MFFPSTSASCRHLETFGRPLRVEWHFQSEICYEFKDVLIVTFSPFCEHSILGHSLWIPITITTSSFESARVCTQIANGKSGNYQRNMSSLQVKALLLVRQTF